MTHLTIAEAVHLIDEADEWSSFKLGEPGPQDEEPWLRLRDAYAPEMADALTRHFQSGEDYRDIPFAIVGNYAFRELCYKPLMALGGLFALQRRVLRTQENLIFRDAEYFQDWRLLQPLAYVLPDDAEAGSPGVLVVQTPEELTEALFAEVEATFAPLVASFRAGRFVAPANAWGSIIDFLGYGFWHAGEHGLGMDAAWDLWERVTTGRSFATRRRPRRFVYQADGRQQELPIRAGCCLWYMTDEAKNSEQGELPYCATCYIPSDAERLTHVLSHQHESGAEE